MTIVYSVAARRAAIFLALCGLYAGLACRGLGAIVEFPIPNPGVQPQGIACGPDGAYWFVESAGIRIGRCDTNGVITEYQVPSGESAPYDIVTGPDGTNLWFSEATTSKIGRIGTNGATAEFQLPFTITGLGVTFGPDGRLWLADFGVPAVPGQAFNGGIVAVTISNGLVTQSSYYHSNMTYACRPNRITSGPDGNLYFTEQAAGQIGRITTNGVISEAFVADGTTQPYDITTGPDGAIWFTQAKTNALGRIDPSDFTNVMEFPMPTNNNGAVDELIGIVLGKDGNLYYSDAPAGIVGRVTVNGTNLAVTQFYTPTTNAFPWRLATGPDTNIWFGEMAGNTMAKFFLPVPLNVQFSNSEFNVSWSTNVGTNFVLEENTSLTNPTNWIFVTNVPATNGDLFTVSIPVTNSPPTNALFFRLTD